MPLSARRALGGARDARDDGGSALRARSTKGVASQYVQETRRRGRAAHLRSPEDSPLRDGNRDRLIGLLTLRAAKTLEYYFMETNLAYAHWLGEYIRQTPIPRDGNWDDVSGETFLRKMLMSGVYETRYKGGVKDELFSCVGSIGIDPRALAQRIMDIRTALSEEFIQDLQAIAEENAVLMRECAMMSLSAFESMGTDSESDVEPGMSHPEMLDGPVTIPDTAAAFLASVTESSVDRFIRQQEEAGSSSGNASSDADSDSGIDDQPRPGLDDINEFESELEAGVKWKRRFRILNAEQSSSSVSDEDAAAEQGTAPSAPQEGEPGPASDGHSKDGPDVAPGAGTGDEVQGK